MSQVEREYGWDEAPIDKPDEGGFVLLPDGTYPFIVESFERGRFAGSAKMAACNQATVTLRVDGGPLGDVRVKHRLFLHSKCQGLLAQFFKGIGHRKEGDPLVMNWGKVPGSHGIVKLGKRTFEGKEFQDVKGFEPPKDGVGAPQYAAPANTAKQDDLPF